MSISDANTLRRVVGAHVPRTVHDPARMQAAVALVFGGDLQLQLLLIKRAEHPRDPWSGQMALPGGRRDSGDVDLVATVVRETREETGIDLERAERVGELDDLAPMTPSLPPVVVRPFVFLVDSTPPITTSPEVSQHLWISPPDLVRSSAEVTIRVRGHEMLVPSFRVGPNIIWGMTYRIINGLFDLSR